MFKESFFSQETEIPPLLVFSPQFSSLQGSLPPLPRHLHPLPSPQPCQHCPLSLAWYSPRSSWYSAPCWKPVGNMFNIFSVTTSTTFLLITSWVGGAPPPCNRWIAGTLNYFAVITPFQQVLHRKTTETNEDGGNNSSTHDSANYQVQVFQAADT